MYSRQQRLRWIYAALKSRRLIGLRKENGIFNKCGEWWSCCRAQGYCILKPRHAGPHLQRGIHGNVIFLKNPWVGFEMKELDNRRIPARYFNALTAKER